MKKFLQNFKWFIVGGFSLILLTAFVAYAASVLTVQQGGTGVGSISNNSLLYGSPTNQSLNVLPLGSTGQVLTVVGGKPAWAAATGSTASILPLIANGTVAGANATSSTVSFNIQGTGTLNPFNVSSSSTSPYLTVLANGNVGIGTSTPIQPLVVNGSTTITSLTAGDIESTAQGNLFTVGLTGTGLSVQQTSPTLITPVLGTPTSITLTNGTGLPLTTGVTGVLPIANGGTNSSTLGSTLVGFVSTSSSNSTFTASIANNSLSLNFPNNLLSTTSAAATYVTAVNGSGSILSTGGLTPSIQLQNLTANDILFGQGNNTIATSSNFTFNSSSNTLAVTGSTTISNTLTVSGNSSLQNASTTGLTVSGALFVTGTSTLATTTITSLTATDIPIAGTGGILQNSSLSQSAGTTLINGATPIIDGGGDWLNNVIQTSGSNVIIQQATSSAVLGNLIQSGGVQYYQATANITTNQFCSGGLYNIASTVPITLTFPTLTQIGTSPCGGSQPVASQFAAQYGVNSGSNTFTLAPSGTGESFLYAPGSGANLYPGQTQFATGQFIATSTISGATTTGMSLNAYIADFQPTSTSPSVMGQLLSADQTGHGWQLTNLVAGSNVTITTTTPGQITIASSGSGGSGTISTSTNAIIGHEADWTGLATLGNGSWLDNGTVTGFNATSSTIGVNIQGTVGTNDILNVASSSGTSMFKVSANNNIVFQNEALPTLSGQKFFTVVGSQAGGIMRAVRDVGLVPLANTYYGTQDITAYSATSTIDWPDLTGPVQTFSIATGTMQNTIGEIAAIREGNDTTGGFNIFGLQNGALTAQIEANGSVNYASIYLQGALGASTTLNVASSSGVSELVVMGTGNVGIGTTTPGNALTVIGSISSSALTNGNCVQAGAGGVLTTTGSACGSGGGGTNYWTNSSNILFNNTGYEVGINSTTPTANLVVEGSSTNPTLPIFTVASSSNTSYLTVAANGNVGINTKTPQSALDINGTLDIKGNNGVFQDTPNLNLALSATAFPTTVTPGVGQPYYGEGNVTVGYQSMNQTTTGYYNVALGIQSLYTNTSGYLNVGIGQNALYSNSSGFFNEAIGEDSLYSNTSGNTNVGIGINSLYGNTTGFNNFGLGASAMRLGHTDTNSVAIGANALYSMDANDGNIAIGASSLYSMTSGGGNVAIGSQIGQYSMISGYGNTILGAGTAATTLSTGSDNILIGSGTGTVDTPQTGTSNYINIGNVFFATNAIGTVASPAGLVGINTTSPTAVLTVEGYNSSANTTTPILIVASSSGVSILAVTANQRVGIGTTSPSFGFVANGTVQMPNLATSAVNQADYVCLNSVGQLIDTSTICVSVSAARFKENISPLEQIINPLAETMAMQAVHYFMKPDAPGYVPGIQYGLIADDIKKIDPNLVVNETATTTFEGKIYPPGTVEGLAQPSNWIGLFVADFQAQQKEIQNLVVGKVHDSQDLPQDILIGFLIIYVCYNEYDKRKGK